MHISSYCRVYNCICDLRTVTFANKRHKGAVCSCSNVAPNMYSRPLEKYLFAPYMKSSFKV